MTKLTILKEANFHLITQSEKRCDICRHMENLTRQRVGTCQIAEDEFGMYSVGINGICTYFEKNDVKII